MPRCFALGVAPQHRAGEKLAVFPACHRGSFGPRRIFQHDASSRIRYGYCAHPCMVSASTHPDLFISDLHYGGFPPGGVLFSQSLQGVKPNYRSGAFCTRAFSAPSAGPAEWLADHIPKVHSSYEAGGRDSAALSCSRLSVILQGSGGIVTSCQPVRFRGHL